MFTGKWEKGEVDGYKYWAKVYEEGSIYGIDEGRISKLEVRKDGKTVTNYDRGWDILPFEDEDLDHLQKM